MEIFEQEVSKFLELLVSPNTGRAAQRVVYVDSRKLEPKLDAWLHKSLSGIYSFDLCTNYVKVIRSHMKLGVTALSKERDNILSGMAWNTLLEFQLRNQSNEKIISSLTNALRRHRLIVKPSDKGGRTVIMSEEYYKSACLKLLNVETDYLTADETAFTRCMTTAQRLLKIHYDMLRDLLGSKYLAMKTKTFRIGFFYGLPKVHKNLTQPPMRPVVSHVDHPTALFSAAINRFTLKWIFKEETVCQSTLNFTNMIDSLPRRNFMDSTFLTVDVNSLYTSIPLAKGIKRFNQYVEERCRSKRDFETLEFIKKTLPFSQYNNIFSFGNVVYRQRKGVAMGCPLGPTFANIYLLELDKRLIEICGCTFYRRYIDDIFMILPYGNVDNKDLQRRINELDEDIKFTVEETGSNVKFLDLDVFLDDGTVKYQLYEKEISCIYRYIEKESLHPPSTTKGIPLGAMKRIRSLTPNRLTCHLLFEDIFLKRLENVGYTRNRMNDWWWRLIGEEHTSELQESNSQKEKEEDFKRIVTPYVRSWRINRMGIRSLNKLIVRAKGSSLKQISITYSCNRSLKSKLVSSKYSDSVISGRVMGTNPNPSPNTKPNPNPNPILQC